jgi:ABC-type transporter Mla maintaining outer membrane lipid asymmetry permease subunit MlaE
MNAADVAKPTNVVGEFFVFSLESLTEVRRLFRAWHELSEQTLLVGCVSIFPTLMRSIPFPVLLGGAVTNPRLSIREYVDRRME